MQRDFQKWHLLKSKIDMDHNAPLFREQEIWWCSLGINIGSEEDGKGKDYLRPILITRKFNKNIFYGLPITSRERDDIFHTPIHTKNVYGSVIMSQMRLIDAKRLSHRMGKITEKDFNAIIKKLKGLFP